MDDRTSEIEVELDTEWTDDAGDRATFESGGAGTGADAEQLADELGRTQLRTTDAGYVEARVTALERIGEDTVRLVTSLPTGETVAFRLDKPVPWSEEFLLARLVEAAGYDAATVDHLVGERVYLDRGDPIDDEGVWAEGTTTVPEAYRSVASAIGLDEFVDTSQRWRLVDPIERRQTTAPTRQLSLPQKLVATTAGFAGTLLALAVLAVTTALGAGATAALAALLFVCYIGVVSTLLVRALRS